MLLFTFAQICLHAQEAAVDTQIRTLRIPRVSRSPKLDDFLNGVPREAELKVTDFRQYRPGDGEPVSQPTTAFLSYDDKNLYVAFICIDDPKQGPVVELPIVDAFDWSCASMVRHTFWKLRDAANAQPVGRS